MYGISFEEGTDAFSRILSRRLPQVYVSTQDFPSMVEGSKRFSIATILEKIKEQRRSRPAYPRPALGTSYAAPGSELERKIAAVWSELLGIDPIGVHDNFFELGGNSLLGIDLVARLRKELNVDNLPAHILYEAPSVSALAGVVSQTQPATVAVEAWDERNTKRREKLKQLKRVKA
jgi:hypothetical protein